MSTKLPYRSSLFFPILTGSLIAHGILIWTGDLLSPIQPPSVLKNTVSMEVYLVEPQIVVPTPLPPEPPVIAEEIKPEIIKEEPPIIPEPVITAVEPAPEAPPVEAEAVIPEVKEEVIIPPQIQPEVVVIDRQKIMEERMMELQRSLEILTVQPLKKAEVEPPVQIETQGAIIEAQPVHRVNPSPVYPRQARLKGWEGSVLLEVSVDEKGIPQQVVVEQSSGYALLDNAARTAVLKWRFEPARRGDRTFASIIRIPVTFKLID